MCSLLSQLKAALISRKTRLLRSISWWGVMFFRFLVEKPIKRVIKESFLLFSRDKLILDKQVRSILFELFWLFLSLTIPLVLVFLSLVLMLVFKFLNHRFLSLSCDSTKAKITSLCRKKLLVFDWICWKYHCKKLFQILQTLPSSNVFSNISAFRRYEEFVLQYRLFYQSIFWIFLYFLIISIFYI